MLIDVTKIDEKEKYPTKELRSYWGSAQWYTALRDLEIDPVRGINDVEEIKEHLEDCGYGKEDEIVPEPIVGFLTGLIATSLFGEDFLASIDGSDKAKSRFSEIIDKNMLAAECLAWADNTLTEGDGFIMLAVDQSTPIGKQVPLLQFYNRQGCNPLFKGRELVALQVIHEFCYGDGWWRVFQTRAEGKEQFQVMYTEKWDEFGKAIPIDDLESYDPPSALLDMKLGTKDQSNSYTTSATLPGDRDYIYHAPNNRKYGGHGTSEVSGLEPLIYALFLANGKGLRNLKASDLKIFADSRLRDEDGNLKDSQVIFLDATGISDNWAQQKAGVPMTTVQANTILDEIFSYHDALFDEIMMLKRITSQSYGRNTSGGTVDSGTALKLRNAMTLIAVSAKARYYKTVLKNALTDAIYLDSILFKTWSKKDLDASINIQLRDGLPDDQLENSQILANAGDRMPVEDQQKLIFPDIANDSEAIEQKVKEVWDDRAKMAKLAVNSKNQPTTPKPPPQVDPSQSKPQ